MIIRIFNKKIFDSQEQGVTQMYNDPMLQQMEIIKNYIRQARQANKHDEVAMLEQNLRELTKEYNRPKEL